MKRDWLNPKFVLRFIKWRLKKAFVLLGCEYGQVSVVHYTWPLKLYYTHINVMCSSQHCQVVFLLFVDGKNGLADGQHETK